MVDDNGPGPEKSKSIVRAKSADHTGRGLTLMRTLFDMLNLHNEHKLNFELIDKAAHGLGAGARVIIEFPKHFHFENGGSIAS
jgi:hypothetical protein